MKLPRNWCIVLFVAAVPAFASAYLPVFSGYWYTTANFIDKDACYKNTYGYQHWGEGNDRAYAQEVFSQLVGHPNCQWGPEFLTAKLSDRPSDFVGSNVEWKTISAASNAIVGERWQRNCVNARHEIVDRSVISIWPNYTCPKPTHYGKDAVTGEFACVDTPLACNADIVGRDLVGADTNKILGHVGLVSTLSGKNTVLEVLPTPPAVYENTLASFIAKSKFWGEKYGLKKMPVLTFDMAKNIVNTGAAQKGVTLEYMWDWKWRPGDKNVHALFRCDSFLYYAYLAGAQLKIFLTGFHFPDNPPSMFKKFLSFRLSQYSDATDPLPILEQVQHYSIMPGDNISYNARLAQVFSEVDLDINAADQLTYQYFYDPNISRSEKMQTLYELAKQHQHDPMAFLYLIDIFAGLEPIEYTPQWIELYRQQISLEVKNHLLSTIGALMFRPYSENKNIPAGNEYNVFLVKRLFQDVVNHAVNPTILNTAIFYYSGIGDPGQAKEEVNAALRRAKNSHIVLHFSPKEYILLKLKLAFHDESTQRRDLPELLAADTKDSDSMVLTVNSLLQELSPESISDEVRPLLQSYLLNNQALILSQNPIYKTYRPDEFMCDWLGAYATVMVKHERDKIPFILSYIRALPSPRDQAKFLEQQYWPVLNKILSADRSYYRNAFQKSLQDPNLSDDDRRMFEYALSALSH